MESHPRPAPFDADLAGDIVLFLERPVAAHVWAPSPPAPASSDPETADTRWLIENYADLVERFPFSWVAVQGQRIVGRGVTQTRALEAGSDNLAPGLGPPHVYFLERTAERRLEH